MIYRYKLAVLLVTACSTFHVQSTIFSSDIVLPQVCARYQADSLIICTSEGTFVVSDAHNPRHSRTVHVSMLCITTDNGLLTINGKLTKSRTLIISSPDGITYNGAHHDGPLSLTWDGVTMTVAAFKKARPALVPVHLPPVTQQERAATVPVEKKTAEREHSYTVRVLLAQQELPAIEKWQLSSKQGFYVQLLGDSKRYQVDSPLQIQANKKVMRINDLNFPADQQLLIIPCKGTTEFDGNTYQGALTLLMHQGQLLLINALALEDYVVCVLNTESWPGWPLEVNKVFAIACRTYAIAMVMNHKLLKQPYHIKNTNAHQTYAGTHSCDIFKQAVQETKGIFVAYNKKPITAMFDACCGGIIPAHVAGINFKHAPYLARSYACTYCSQYKIYQWHKRYTATQIHDAFRGIAPRIKKIKLIKEFNVIKRDKAGLVQEVTIKGSGNAVIRLTGKQIYGSLKGIKSRYFDIEKKGAHFTVSGYGYGHHMGLCQWGAYGMVQAGYGYKDVLTFYYPGTTFMHLG